MFLKASEGFWSLNASGIVRLTVLRSKLKMMRITAVGRCKPLRRTRESATCSGFEVPSVIVVCSRGTPGRLITSCRLYLFGATGPKELCFPHVATEERSGILAPCWANTPAAQPASAALEKTEEM